MTGNTPVPPATLARHGRALALVDQLRTDLAKHDLAAGSLPAWHDIYQEAIDVLAAVRRLTPVPLSTPAHVPAAVRTAAEALDAARCIDCRAFSYRGTDQGLHYLHKPGCPQAPKDCTAITDCILNYRHDGLCKRGCRRCGTSHHLPHSCPQGDDVSRLADEIRTTLGDCPEEFDVPAIAQALLTRFGAVESVDSVPSDEYWMIVRRHEKA